MTTIDIPRVLLACESLGENCDLGFIQRAIGLEPLGLLRFAGCAPKMLIGMLEQRFEPLGTPADTYLKRRGNSTELWLRSRSFGLEIHTFQHDVTLDLETVLGVQARKLRLMKAQLLRALSDGSKLFVLRTLGPFDLLQQLVRALQSLGPNTVLIVSAADADHPAGLVEQIQDGLLRGYVSRPGRYHAEPSLPFQDWLTICTTAYCLWRGQTLPKRRVHNYIVLASPGGLEKPMNAQAAAVAGCTPVGQTMLTHTIMKSPWQKVLHCVHVPVVAPGSYVFSAWVKLPRDFKGVRIGVRIGALPPAGRFAAAMAARDEWQFIWTQAELDEPMAVVVCNLIGLADSGQVFYSAGWCLEQGLRPTVFGFMAPEIVTTAPCR